MGDNRVEVTVFIGVSSLEKWTETSSTLPSGLFEDGWARTAEPEAAPSEHLHVTGLLQGIEALRSAF